MWLIKLLLEYKFYYFAEHINRDTGQKSRLNPQIQLQ